MVSGWNDCFKDVCINLFNLGQWPAFVTLQIMGLKYRYAHKHDYGTWNTDINQKGSTMRVHWTVTSGSDSEFQVFLQCNTFTLTNSDLYYFTITSHSPLSRSCNATQRRWQATSSCTLCTNIPQPEGWKITMTDLQSLHAVYV